MTITEFLTARLDEAEARLQEVFSQMDRPHWPGCDYPGDMPGVCDCDLTEWLLADIAAKRAILELHKQWPILIEGPPKFETDASGLDSVAFKMSRQIAWATEQEYRNRFGDEPPTTPILRALASVYADHPDYQQEWA